MSGKNEEDNLMKGKKKNRHTWQKQDESTDKKEKALSCSALHLSRARKKTQMALQLN